VLIGSAKAAAEVKDGIVISQGQFLQQFSQILETGTDFRWVIFMGFLIGLVELIQDGLAVAVTRVKWVCFDVCFQPVGDVIHCRSAPPG